MHSNSMETKPNCCRLKWRYVCTYSSRTSQLDETMFKWNCLKPMKGVALIDPLVSSILRMAWVIFPSGETNHALQRFNHFCTFKDTLTDQMMNGWMNEWMNPMRRNGLQVWYCNSPSRLWSRGNERKALALQILALNKPIIVEFLMPVDLTFELCVLQASSYARWKEGEDSLLCGAADGTRDG